MTNSIEKIFTGSGIDVQCGEEYASVARIVKLRGENTGKYAIIKVAGMSQEEIWDATTEAENNGKINTQKSLYLAEKYAELVADAVINELCALEAFAEAAFDYLPTTPTITMPADTGTMIFKTKYTRRRNGKPESFVGYDLSINGNEKIIFPKGTTLPQIKKAYPQHADAAVVVMPSHILKGINTAECEEITTVTVKKNYTTTPADVVIEAATEEEQAADLATEPADAIYTVEKERPAVVAATEQPAKIEPTLAQWINQAKVRTTAAKPKV